MYSSTKRRRIKPFARPTAFDINVAYDIRHYQQCKYGKGSVSKTFFSGKNSDEGYNVMEGEILMKANKPQVKRYGDHQMHVFSFANGLEGKDKAGVMRELKYAGIAVTGFAPEKDVFEQGFVLSLGGLNTLFNNGSLALFPGDILCADIPDPADRKSRFAQTGVPHDKVQFTITTFEQLKADVGDAELASRFIFGTALSYSRPGNGVDVVLHRCNAIIERGRSTNSGATKVPQRRASTGFEDAESSVSKKKKSKK